MVVMCQFKIYCTTFDSVYQFLHMRPQSKLFYIAYKIVLCRSLMIFDDTTLLLAETQM